MITKANHEWTDNGNKWQAVYNITFSRISYRTYVSTVLSWLLVLFYSVFLWILDCVGRVVPFRCRESTGASARSTRRRRDDVPRTTALARRTVRPAWWYLRSPRRSRFVLQSTWRLRQLSRRTAANARPRQLQRWSWRHD